MSDQREYWDTAYADSGSARHERPPSRFGEHALRFFPKTALVLELGCGRGADALRMAQHGHTVLATDFAEPAIAANQRDYAGIPNLEFRLLPIAAPSPFADASFDVVYAHLSLHYFPDRETRDIFRDLHRILRPGGLLAFLCKSTDDPLYGKGERIESDMFDYAGHVRHFFSALYARSCLDGRFDVIELTTGKETFYERDSAYVQVLARKPAHGYLPGS
jgi:SAM-dependent methyltransferase